MRLIDADALYQTEKLLGTNIVRQDKVASELLAQVLYDIQHFPTLTPPNEWVNRVRELDELYTKLQIVTGFTAEQLLEIFATGYTLEKPDYSKKFAEMENLAEAAQPNDPLTIEQLREMDGEPVWIANPDALQYGRWGIVDGVYQEEDDQVLMLRNDYSCHYYGKTWLAYRRPPEGEA